MKTIIMVFAMVFTLSFAGSASNVSSVAKNQTESSVISQTSSSSVMQSGKSKKGHHKHHKSKAGSKKRK